LFNISTSNASSPYKINVSVTINDSTVANGIYNGTINMTRRGKLSILKNYTEINLTWGINPPSGDIVLIISADNTNNSASGESDVNRSLLVGQDTYGTFYFK